MNLTSKKWLAPIGAVLALLLMVAWMAGMFHAKVPPDVLPTANPTSAPVGAFTVELTEVAATEAVPATIGARQATTVSSRVMARITRILVRAGDSVSEGQLLLELERSELESRLSQARQRVLAGDARLKEAQQDLWPGQCWTRRAPAMTRSRPN
jgi:membrane fusion protein, multidrug efflux system